MNIFDFIEEQRERAERAEAALATTQRDAERYRWLRENINAIHFCQYMNYHPSEAEMWSKPESIDAAIDRALAEKEKP